jgi:hypothetical protein
MIHVERIPPTDAHDGQKWLRLRGRVEGSPEATWKTRTVNVAALVSGKTTVEAERAKLEADVAEYHARWVALKDLKI